MLCICIEVCQLSEGIEYKKLFEVLSTLEYEKLKINNLLIKKYKDMLYIPDFEQDCYSRTTEGVYKVAPDSIRLMKWMCYYDRSSYENINYYAVMGSICKYNIDNVYE